MAICWQQHMSVGIHKFDAQHKNMLAMCDRIGAAAGTDLNRSAMGVCLKKLIDYIEGHLTQEDEFLSRIGYPDAEAHRNEDRKLLDDLKWFMDQFLGEGSFALNHDALRFLGIWVEEHVTAVDSRYRTFVE